jgi:hypothetical protein
MNIHTVKENLIRTIAGKESYLEEVRQARLRGTDREDIALFATQEMLKINIDELKRILADVEVCCEKATADSWRGVDRQGGI